MKRGWLTAVHVFTHFYKYPAEKLFLLWKKLFILAGVAGEGVCDVVSLAR